MIRTRSGHILKTRSDLLLLLIEAHCHNDGRYWVAQAGEQYVETVDEWVTVYGGGDMRALHSLEEKGYISAVKAYPAVAYRITEDGKLRAQTLA